MSLTAGAEIPLRTSRTSESGERQPLYLIDEKIQAQNIVLKLDAGPVLLGDKYARLAGVVRGGEPLALLEFGGRGLCLMLGDEAAGYLVVSIGANSLELKKLEERP
ncbi:MAG: hypothetical protein JW782_05095 [Candidatus Saganbacteria bacterium]|nr:hypothetical protein [Candidatus Saganbacteria bacterium]